MIKRKEPLQLKRGKAFQKIVQNDYQENSKGQVKIEEHVSFAEMQGIKQLRGRMDIVVHDDKSGYIMIMEIKATDWDKIKTKNIKRNLYRHSRQLYNYVDKFLDVDDLSVGIAVLYPKPPVTKGLKEKIEQLAMDCYCFPVYWYNELRTIPNS